MKRGNKMIDIKIEGEFPDTEKFILESIKKHYIEKAGDLLCPEHKELAVVTFKGTSTKDLSVNIHTCCDKFNATITERLKSK
jgi:hypothetical protein